LKREAFSGIMLILLFLGMLTLAFNIQPVKSEHKTWTVDDDGPADFSTIQEDTDRSSIKHWSRRAIKSYLKDGLGKRLMDVFQLPCEANGRWDFDSEVKWSDFACIDDDSGEIVIGLNDMRLNSYSELVDLVMSNEGELVNTVSMNGKIGAVVADIPYVAISTFTSEVETAELSRYIEPNKRFQVDFVPNDPNWTKQWGPRRIEADYAWNTTIGDPSVLVAVIDTGIDWDHPDLAANYVPLGYDWVNNDTDPMDDHGHGTHCAGVIAAVLNNSIGIAGLAQVRIMAEKGLDEYGSGSEDDLANAIIHAVDQGADILSNSWGGYGESALIYEAVKYAYDHGVLVIAAAGNDATECKHYPAAYEEVVAVTATNETDHPAWFTNFGDWIEVAAPGVYVYSTLWNDTYEYKSGTSMSAPHVAGVAALIWSQFPNMTRDQVRAQLLYTADDLGDPGFDEYYGYGRINARRAVEQLLPDHDLVLLGWKVLSILKPFETGTINGTLLNFGAYNESDITVRLLINGSVAESVLVSRLVSGASTTISFAWSPTAEGKYNVTLHVAPVHGEISTENNVLFRYVIVRLLKIIMVPNDFSTVQKAINEVSPGYTIRVETGLYYEHIVIDKSITLIGESRKATILDGDGIERVVWVYADNVNITAFTIQNGEYGIFLFYSCHNNISGNIITNNFFGTFLAYSDSNTLRDNNMTNNEYNLNVIGDLLPHFIHDIDTSNTVDGNPIYYLINQYNLIIDATTFPHVGYLALVNSTNITVRDLNLTNNIQGVLFAYTNSSTIANVTALSNLWGILLVECFWDLVYENAVIDNLYGVDLWDSYNCAIIRNRITKCFDGITLDGCGNNTIQGNNIVLIRYYEDLGVSRWGIILVASCNNTIFDNEVTETHTGIYLYKSSFNNMANNTIANNGIGNRYDCSGNNTIIANLITENALGIHFEVSGDNIIYHNDIINNEKQVRSQDSINTWDDHYPSGGNYWSDYIGEDMKSGPYQNQPGGDGIGDTPYVIDMDNRDRYPLWYPWTMPPPEHELAVFLKVPTIIPPGYRSLLGATVVNKGLNNETSVELLLMIDGNIVNSTIVAFLQAGSSYMIDHQWEPPVGMYNITAYAPPLTGEEFTVNNVVIKTVSVFGDTSIYVNPLESTVIGLGETFAVNINVAAVEDLYAWQIKLYYDPAVLRWLNATYPTGHIFDRKPFFPLDPVNETDASGTYIVLYVGLLGDIPRFSGSGILCRISFEAKAPGTSMLNFSRPLGEWTWLCNYDLEDIPFTALDGLVEVIPVHDVAIIKVSPSLTETYEKWIVPITVTAKNEGDTNETLTVTAYYDNTTIETQTIINLASGEDITLNFLWDTTGVSLYISHTIWAEASTVPNEINADNNVFTNGNVIVKMLGDVNGDGKVDGRDIAVVAQAFASYPTRPRWNPNADLNQDNKIDGKDISLVAKNFGKTYP